MVLSRFYFVFVLLCSIASQAGTLEITKEDLKGLKPLNATQQLPQLSSSKEKILYFWATWCTDCKEKLTTHFKKTELYKKYDIYLIATDKDLSKIEHYQNKNEIVAQIAIDTERSLQKKLNVFSVPTLVKIKTSDEKLMVVSNQSGGDIRPLLE